MSEGNSLTIYGQTAGTGSGAGIGGGSGSGSGTFSTGTTGNAFIVASRISDNSEEEKAQWNSGAIHHWHKCTVSGCGERSDTAAHDFGEWTIDTSATAAAASPWRSRKSRTAPAPLFSSAAG